MRCCYVPYFFTLILTWLAAGESSKPAATSEVAYFLFYQHFERIMLFQVKRLRRALRLKDGYFCCHQVAISNQRWKHKSFLWHTVIRQTVTRKLCSCTTRSRSFRLKQVQLRGYLRRGWRGSSAHRKATWPTLTGSSISLTFYVSWLNNKAR